jgi:hypothetical protein
VIASFLLVGDQPHARLMVKSVKDVIGCPIVQMSDLQTPQLEGVDEVIRLPFKVPLMVYRLRHLWNYPHERMLILDTDIICKKPVDDVWGDFDIALTKRPKKHSFGMPYNTGVMFSQNRNFWGACHDWLIWQRPNLQAWYGDQYAVARMAGSYNVKTLAVEEFNWSPNFVLDASDKARFWHYKGSIRKKWMLNTLECAGENPAEMVKRAQSSVS